MTARDQYVINQYKTGGRGRGGASYSPQSHSVDEDGEITSSCYGNVKRSLGTRYTSICTYTMHTSVFLISLYGTPLAQRASYLALHSSLWASGTVNYDYIVSLAALTLS